MKKRTSRRSAVLALLMGIQLNGAHALYAEGNPLMYVDPEGLAACVVEFPEMPIDTGFGFSSTSLGGHAGVLGYADNGKTRYYEYGRYHPEQDGVLGARLPKDAGNVRRVPIPNLQMGADGQPTQDSLAKLKDALARKAGKGTPANLTCSKDVDETKVYEYAQGLAADESRPLYSWKPWSPNQCRTFARRALEAGR